MTRRGRMIGVGLGPGDPDLVTLKAARVIGAAEVIAYPALPGAESFARRIAAPHMAEGVREIVVEVPITPERGPAQAAYDAGAEMIFPEALKNESEFERFRKEISVPLLSNMTEFGKSKLLNQKQLENLGYNLVIYPVTTFRLAAHAVEEGLKSIYENKLE